MSYSCPLFQFSSCHIATYLWTWYLWSLQLLNDSESFVIYSNNWYLCRWPFNCIKESSQNHWGPQATLYLKGVGIPEYYLGADIIQAKAEWSLEPADWIISSKTYTKNVIEKFKQLMADGSPKYFFGEYKIPMDKDYHPELDDSPLINAELQNRYQSMIV